MAAIPSNPLLIRIGGDIWQTAIVKLQLIQIGGDGDAKVPPKPMANRHRQLGSRWGWKFGFQLLYTEVTQAPSLSCGGSANKAEILIDSASTSSKQKWRRRLGGSAN